MLVSKICPEPLSSRMYIRVWKRSSANEVTLNITLNSNVGLILSVGYRFEGSGLLRLAKIMTL